MRGGINQSRHVKKLGVFDNRIIMPQNNENIVPSHPLGNYENPHTRDTGRPENNQGREYARCEECEAIQEWGEMNEWQCDECVNRCSRCECSPCECDDDREYFSIPERLYSPLHLPAFQSNDNGKYIISPRIFSAEIECYVPDKRAMNAIAKDISESVGITSDGSLSDHGVELQTPLLKGKNGELALKAICRVLNAQGATVNKETGLHIHLDGKGLLPKTITTTEPTALKQLWQFYVAFDDVMLSFLPTSRRNCQYAKPMKQSARYTALAQAKTQADLEAIWYGSHNRSYVAGRKAHSKDSSRYAGVNIHILLAEKHLEIRFHSGTLNATKILEWTAMHQRICDLATAGELVTSESMLDLALDVKTKMFFAILKLPDHAEKYFMRRQEQFMSKRITTGDSYSLRSLEANTSVENDLEIIEELEANEVNA